MFKAGVKHGLAISESKLGRTEAAKQLWRDAEALWPAFRQKDLPNYPEICVRSLHRIREQARHEVHKNQLMMP